VFAAPGHDDQGPPPTVIEHQPRQSSRRRDLTEDETAMAHLFAVANEAGLDDTEVHTLTVGVGSSLKEASSQMLHDWARWIKAATDDEIDAALERGSIAEDGPAQDLGAEIEAEYLAKISTAQSQAELSEIAKQMGESGIGTEPLRDAYRARQAWLRKADQQSNGELAGMPSDVSRYADA
jgi:hypothetical protein